MEAILAQRFSPSNFSFVPGFPNVVPTIDEWGYVFLKFREHRDDNPTEHLLVFHEFMHQWGIHHEDVLMNMFMYSLEGYSREWYRSLPLASISSLEQFHVAFNKHCKWFFSADLLFENCFEEFESHIPQSFMSSSSSESKGDFLVEEMEEDLVTYESSSDHFIEKDDVGNYINDEIDDKKDLDTSFIIPCDSDSHCYDTFVLICSNKYFINCEESYVEGHEHVFPLPFEIVEKKEIYKPEDDILELEQGQANNVGDIPIHL
jgi:hypothetical protein